MSLTAVALKKVAQKINLEGRSKLRKAELENAVMSIREGRKEVYGLRDAQWAVGQIDNLLSTGYLFIPKPPRPTMTEVTGVFRSFKELAAAKGLNPKDVKQKQKDFAAYCGQVKALKQEIRNRGLHMARWNESEKGFMVSVNVRKAA